MTRIAWEPVIERAREIVLSFDTAVTLRQLFYRLVAPGWIPNAESAYKHLSRLTAALRRQGSFPSLIDMTRRIEVPTAFDGPEDALEALIGQYRRDRTEGQPSSVYIAVEKATLVAQLSAWFGHLGVPIVALRGYASESYIEEIADHIERQNRPAVLLDAVDFDPSGEDIERDLRRRLGGEHRFERIALTHEQVLQYDLPMNPGKSTDSRAGGFASRHGGLYQVELEALDPAQLRTHFQEALDRELDVDALNATLVRENEDRLVLEGLAQELQG